MAKQNSLDTTNYISDLHMNGLHGHVLYVPPKNKRTKRHIIVVHGPHATLEHMIGLAQELSAYGDVIIPDLPGLGGMQSLQHVGQKPTLDNLADYLAAFIKLQTHRRSHITLVGVSFGFSIVTRTLQRYPAIARKIDLLISLNGFTHHEDLKLSRSTYLLARYGLWPLGYRFPAWLARHTVLRAPFIRAACRLQAGRKSNPIETEQNLRQERVEAAVELWTSNDLATYIRLIKTMLKLNLCNNQVNLAVHHVGRGDHLFNSYLVEQHLSIIFSGFKGYQSRAAVRSQTSFIPIALRRILQTPRR